MNEPGSLPWVLCWSAIIAVVAMDVTKTCVFRRFRRGVRTRNEMLGKLLACVYCLAHWLALGVCLWYWVNLLWTFVLVSVSTAPMLLIAWTLLLLERPELQDPKD